MMQMQKMARARCNLRHGLNGFQLKLFALVTMTMDHLAAYLPVGVGIPEWFHLIGRFAAPLFVFFCAEGFYHTHSRGRYMGRLYLGAVAMTLMNHVISVCFAHPSGVIVINGMFSTMFLITLTLWSVESLRAGIRTHNKGQIAGGLCGLLYLIGSTVLEIGLFLALSAQIGADGMIVPGRTTALLQGLARLVSLLMPNLVMTEGGFLFVLLGVAFFYLRRWRVAQAAVLGGYSLLCLALLPQEWLTHLFVFLAAIPMLLYNGQAGKNRYKYLFYWYYPLHVYGIYVAGWVMITCFGVAG